MHKIIVGVCIIEDGKILMVQEAQKKCYGQWNFPAGHLDPNEDICEGARREAKEETGFDVELIGVLPIFNYAREDDQLIRISFMAKKVGGEISYDKNEILDVKWIPIEELEKMTDKELRAFKCNREIISDAKTNNVYPLGVIKNMVDMKG